MFGLPSFSKLAVLVAIILAVWYGFKLISKLDAARKVQARERARTASRGPKTRRAVPDAEEMKACPACHAYVPAAHPSNCGRADCPY